ncbi:MAG: hypothetical protein WAL25_01475 [Acidimicrobiia bacterium]
MIYLTHYQDIKRITEERRRKSLATLEARRSTIDSFVRAKPEPEAEVIELMLGPACLPESLGA